MNTLDKIVFNLSTIGKIQKGQKILTSQEFINIDEDRTFTFLARTLTRENRDKGAYMVTMVLENAFLVAELLMESKYFYINAPQKPIDHDIVTFCVDQTTEREARVRDLVRLHSAITACTGGLKNLCTTYSSDSNILAKLMPLLEQIETNGAKLSSFLTQHGVVV
jgi:hypothetical protein